MKKRLFLVNYKFTTAGHEYNEYKLVSIKFEGTMDQEWGMRLAEAQVRALFEGSESKLIDVTASTALEAEYPKRRDESSNYTADFARGLRRSDLDDMIDADKLSIDRVLQLISETAPFTDRLVLKDLMPGGVIENLEKRGFYVNTMIDENKQDDYTVIVW